MHLQSTQPIDETSELTRKHLGNILNSQKSTGPRTEAGKNRVAANALKHRLTGQKLWLEADEFPDYFTLGMELIEDFRPVGAYESQLVQKIIDHNWRVNRCSMLDNNLHVTGLDIHNPIHQALYGSDDTRTLAVVAQAENFRKDCATSNSFEKLSRIGGRLQRELFRLTKELNERQAMRMRREGRDTFVLKESKAWRIYEDSLAAHEESQRLRAISNAALDKLKADSQSEQNETTSELALFCQNPANAPCENLRNVIPHSKVQAAKASSCAQAPM